MAGTMAPLYRRTPVFVLLSSLAASFVVAAADKLPSIPAAYQLSARIALGEGKRWDYLLVEDATRRLYLAHGDAVDVVDLGTRRLVGRIGGLRGTHGVAVAREFGRGYISDGKSDSVVVFDLSTLARVRTIAVGRNPDAIVFDPASKRIAVFNGGTHDASILDAASGDVIAASVELGGKPEFSRVDGSGHAYVNIEDTAEIVDLDLQQARVHRRYSIAPCVEPTGLAIDGHSRLYSVCANHLMIISDPAGGTVLGRAPIGARPDGVVFDDGFAYSANGGDGTISVVGEPRPGSFATVRTIASQPGARTIDVEARTHALYLPAAGASGTPSASELELLVFTRL